MRRHSIPLQIRTVSDTKLQLAHLTIVSSTVENLEAVIASVIVPVIEEIRVKGAETTTVSLL
jgi:hypothetical protein